MNENDLFEAIGETDDEMLENAENPQKKNNTWIKISGAAAAVSIVAAGAAGIKAITDDIHAGDIADNTTAAAANSNPPNAYSPETVAMLLSAATYPDMPQYPVEFSENFDEQYDKWNSFIRENRYISPVTYLDSINKFTQDSMNAFLTDSGNENRIVSPMNIYFALGLLAESAEGNSRQQILDLMGAEDMDTLREYSNTMWKRNYSDDGAFVSIFANSVWLSDILSYNTDTLKLLSESYYADIFSGNVADKAYTNAFQEWLNVKTGGMLEEEAKQLEFDPETVFSLASTVYFRGKWYSDFNPELTEKDIFTTPSGEKTECDFMKREEEDSYFWGDNFSAMRMDFDGSNGQMWLFLPDEGVTTDELIESGEIMKLLNDKSYRESHWKRLIVNFALPKFDTAYSTDLKAGFAEMGVTDVFDSNSADFTGLLGEEYSNTALSAAQHAVRVAIDEEGCTATAFTAMMAAGAAPPPDEKVDFILDRPFIFVITGASNDPVFAGVINNPAI